MTREVYVRPVQVAGDSKALLQRICVTEPVGRHCCRRKETSDLRKTFLRKQYLDFLHFNHSCIEEVKENLLHCGIRSVSGGCAAWAAGGGGAGAAGVG